MKGGAALNNNIIFSDLRAEMARNNIRIKDMAKAIGVTRDTMGLKLSGKAPLRLDEAFKINRDFFPNKSLWELFKELENSDQPERR